MSPYEFLTVMSITPRVCIEAALFLITDIKPIVNGNQKPVMLLPGLGVGESQMEYLKRYLTKCGYDARHWGLGLNLNRDYEGGEFEEILEQIEALHKETNKKVTLVGWSLGGALARLAANESDAVDCVVTIGTPFAGDHTDNPIYDIFKLVKNVDCDPKVAGLYDKLRNPVTKKAVSIYSRHDGMVHWKNCVGSDTESIEVKGTHVGMMLNPEVFKAVARSASE